MKHLFSFFLFLILIGCSSNKFKIEQKPAIEFKEAYFQRWAAGVKGGGAGIHVFLVAQESLKNVTLEGVYFRDSYAELKFSEPNNYQAFIKTDGNSEVLSPDGTLEKKTETKTEKIPFELNKNEAVISYLDNGVKKYFRIQLKEKQLDNVPM